MKYLRSLSIGFLVLCFLGAGLVSSAERERDNKTSKVKSTTTTVTEQTKTKQQTPGAPQTTAVDATTPTETAASSPSYNLKMTGEKIDWFVISSGATNATSTNYQLQGTIGQLAVGDASSTNYIVKSGYWQNFGSGSCCALRGNTNGLGGIDIADVTFLVGYMFKSGPEPPCVEEGNVNALGGIDIADLTFLVAYMFKSGPPPPAC